jgi:hypothetical protein
MQKMNIETSAMPFCLLFRLVSDKTRGYYMFGIFLFETCCYNSLRKRQVKLPECGAKTLI